MKSFLTVALLASAIAAPACATELVVNGGFESPNGLNNGWSYTVSNTQYVLINPPVAHSGDASLIMAAEADYLSDFLYQDLDTVVGQTYNYSFWLSSGTGDSNAPSSFYASIGSDVMADFAYTGDFSFIEISGTYLATSATTQIYFEAFNSLGLYQLDDISVTTTVAQDCGLRLGCGGGGGGGEGGVPEPATWGLMMVGFGGIGAVLRRRRPALAA